MVTKLKRQRKYSSIVNPLSNPNNKGHHLRSEFLEMEAIIMPEETSFKLLAHLMKTLMSGKTLRECDRKEVPRTN